MVVVMMISSMLIAGRAEHTTLGNLSWDCIAGAYR